jgi:hypothetical protein
MHATVNMLEEDVKVPYQKFVKKKLLGGDVYETPIRTNGVTLYPLS